MIMDLIFIYGNPGVGKLTVAKELEKLTGYRIFHAHHTVDLVKTLYDWGTPEFSKLNQSLRLQFFESAIKSNISGLIFTYCYKPKKNNTDNFVNNVIDIFEKSGGKVHFVYLSCSEEELFKRVENEDRRKYSKVDKIGLTKCIHHFGKIDSVENFEIDNTNISPTKTAELIIKKYGIKNK